MRLALCLGMPLALAAFATPAQADPGKTEDLRRQVVSVVGAPGTAGCTGVVIGRGRVLTAAHCLMAPASAYSVEMIGSDGRLHSVRVASSRRHPGFNRTALEHDGEANDLATLTLAEPLPDDAQPARLATSGAAADETVWAVGMEGSYFTRLSDRLRIMKLSANSDRASRVMLQPMQGGGGQPCHGDSGGPVFRRTAAGFTLIAIISWGSTHCDGATAATSVSHYRPFIGS